MLEANDHQESVAADDVYRSWSASAVSVVVMGVLSATALATPLLWFVPLLTIVLGAGILRSLARHPEKMGRRAVILGIALAIFFGAWATSRYFSRQWTLYEQAHEIADTWPELVCTKQLRQAHQLTLFPLARVPEDVSVDEFYEKNSEIQSEVYTLFDKPPLATIVSQQEDPTFTFEGPVSHVQEGMDDIVTLRYSVHFEENQQSRSLPIDVILSCRTNRIDHQHAWHVQYAKNPDS